MDIKFFRVMLIGSVAFFLAVVGVRVVQGQEVPAEAIELSNKVMLKIFQDIFDAKANYPDLQDFGETHLFKNRHGIYGIRYDAENPVTKDPYHLGITIGLLSDVEFPDERGQFNYGFPKINLKISGFQQKHPLRTQFDVMPLVTKYGMILAEYQQQFMPLRIFIRPIKEEFQVKEDIEFDVILENVTKRHMIVKSLGQETLYFLINNQVWGTSPSSGQRGGTDVVLRSGQRTVVRLKGESFQRPQEVEVTCFYRMSIGGVNPLGKAKIIIHE